MSEYIEIETEETDDPLVLILESNIVLAMEGEEVYESAESLEEGSPLAQALSVITGITHLIIEEHTLTVTRNPEYEWYAIIEDVRAAIVDFFL